MLIIAIVHYESNNSEVRLSLKFFSKKIQKVGAGHRDQRRNNFIFIFFFNLEASSRRSITVQAYDRATTCGLGGDGLDVASPLCAEVAQVQV